VEDETETRTLNASLHDVPGIIGNYNCVEAVTTSGEDCDMASETDCCSPYDNRFDEYHGFCEYTHDSILNEWHLSLNACMDNGLGTDPVPCSCDEILSVSLGQDTNKMLQTSCSECSSPWEKPIDNSPTEGCCSWDVDMGGGVTDSYSLESLQSECTQSILQTLMDQKKPTNNGVSNVSWSSSACSHGCCDGGTYDKQQTTQADCELNGGNWKGAGTNCCCGGTIGSFSIPVTNIGSGTGACQIHATGSSSLSPVSSCVWEMPVTITATSEAASDKGGTLMSGTVTISYVESQDHYTITLNVPNTDESGDYLVITGTTTGINSGCGEGTKTGTFTGDGAENHFPCYNGPVDPSNKIANPWTGTFSFGYTYP
tara:strand:- start:3626 stop:4738 length:1113 start_codon:yes stop_codon:yes gene_type:complete